jgi:hypothetical protein
VPIWQHGINAKVQCFIEHGLSLRRCFRVVRAEIQRAGEGAPERTPSEGVLHLRNKLGNEAGVAKILDEPKTESETEAFVCHAYEFKRIRL